MPRNVLRFDFPEMDPGFSPSGRPSDFDSRDSSLALRWSFHNDETLRYLTREEKNALRFFEETIDSLRDDLDEPEDVSDASCDSGSPRLMQESPSSHSEPEEIIDLVQAEPETGEAEEQDVPAPWKITDPKPEPMESAVPDCIPVALPMTSADSSRLPPPDFAAERPKLHGAVPTPVIVAQKICEKQAENASLSPTSPQEGRVLESKRNAATSPMQDGEDVFSYPPLASSKLTRFPSNININKGGKEYNKTISKAAVNVQERKAQVLANLNGAASLAEELEEPGHRSELLSHGRGSSSRDLASAQARYEALTKLGLLKETPVQVETSFAVPDPAALPAHVATPTPAHMATPAPALPAHVATPSPAHVATPTPALPAHVAMPAPALAALPAHVAVPAPAALPAHVAVPSPALAALPAHVAVPSPAHVAVPTPALAALPAHVAVPAPAHVAALPTPHAVDGYKLQHTMAESHERYCNGYDNINSILKSGASPFVPLSKTITFKADPVPAAVKPAQPSASQGVYEPRLPSFTHDVRRTSSMPRPSGFRPQSITVQFSGRDSSEESRKDALRKLGLLKETA
ncbi:proline and serine-rich protein 2 isoform X2 [Rhinatrema bivittatum]|uniref:proline and serine-rich protein 2 isoform X2 n=1 Tax=Rhinatrema bivittatum TaxID=194408 RepID=UPI00112735F7|nr:proline and serine-rich protein 2 isoform X2 [Rhinatrema bivittatum]XP_029472039.1 proline and serine-rich protein 2 isoform X2 [Rhinatrema bivittatum]XP_029472040.1 proline and serine-rich protein 2 isoform X2 [Rhinatrema bivittatum]